MNTPWYETSDTAHHWFLFLNESQLNIFPSMQLPRGKAQGSVVDNVWIKLGSQLRYNSKFMLKQTAWTGVISFTIPRSLLWYSSTTLFTIQYTRLTFTTVNLLNFEPSIRTKCSPAYGAVNTYKLERSPIFTPLTMDWLYVVRYLSSFPRNN